jgi:transposase
MSLTIQKGYPIPEETVRVARAIFPKGNVYMRMRDELGVFYQDAAFASLFPTRGRPAESPGLLALVTVMQFAEDLTDRQAADAVRSRIDWKYALGLELTDPGFDYTLLSDFRLRLIEGSLDCQLLDLMLERFKTLGLLKAGGTQRTDSTHVLAAVRHLNRLELVGETLRHLLNTLAVAAPAWLQVQIPPEWYERYATRFEASRLPTKAAERQALAEQIGRDGTLLLQVLYEETTPRWLRQVPAVEITRQIWLQQYYVQEGQMRWRARDDLPPGKQLIESPFDEAARYSYKRSTEWVGYKVHLTECCDAELPHLLTHVITTPATTGDVEETATVHRALQDKQLLPHRHLVDAGYTDAELLEEAQRQYGLELCGPVREDSSWQARTEGAFALADFRLDWEARSAECPQGHSSTLWSEGYDDRGQATITIHFAHATCRDCPVRQCCTQAAKKPRKLKIRPQPVHEALQAARHYQTTEAFKQTYAARAGIEGTISQATRTFGLRRSRYVGLEKTHFQHIAVSAAINLIRFHAWREERPFAPTRISAFKKLQPQAA